MEPAPTAILDDRDSSFLFRHTLFRPRQRDDESSPTRLNPGHNKPRIKGILRSPPKSRGGPAPTESTLVADDTPGLSQSRWLPSLLYFLDYNYYTKKEGDNEQNCRRDE